MTLKGLKKILKTVKTPKQARKAGILLKKINEGAFRKVYEVLNLNEKFDVIIKFPHYSRRHGNSCIIHSIEEFNNYIYVKKKYPKLKAYLPEVYYLNEKTGVLVMRKYNTFSFKDYDVGTILSDLFVEILQKSRLLKKGQYGDIHFTNLGYESSNSNPYGGPALKIIDLGYLLELG